MTKKKSIPDEAAALRQQAEKKNMAGEDTTPQRLSPEQTQQVIHVLRGQLIELEEQNENLRQKQVEPEAGRVDNPPGESGSLLSQIFNMVSEIIFELAVEPGDNFRFISVNQSFLIATGLSLDQVVGKRYQEVIPEPAHALVLANYQKAIQEKKTVHWEETSVYPAGKRYGEVSVTPVFDEGGRCSQLIGMVHDVSGYKQAEEKINLLNRILRVISAVNQIIVRATDEASLLNEICRTIVEVGGYRLAWVGFAEHDRAKSVLPVAYFGFEEGYLAAVKITWKDTKRGRGPTGKAIRSGKTVVVQNIRNEPGYQPWRQQALQRGYAASLAVPLTVEGQCLGVLNIYAAEPQAFDAGQVKLLEELAQDLAVGIAVLRARAVHEQAETWLRESEDKFKYVFDHSVIGKSITLPSGEINVNHALCEMLGYSQKELEHRTWQTITHPEDIAVTQDAIDSLLSSQKESVRFIKRYLHKNGSSVWGDENTVLRRDESGKPLYFMTSIIDITERKLAEEKLEEERILLRTLIDNLPDRIYVKDSQGRKILSNMADWQASGGKTEKDIIGKTDFDTYPTELAEDYWALDRTVIDSGISNINREEPGLDSQGNPVWILSSKVPLRDGQGKVVGLVGIGRDISEHKQAEQQLTQYSEHLEEMVKERTRELSEAQERLVSQERLKVLGQLAGGVGHELRNPLGVISNAIYYLKIIQPDADDKVKEYLNIVERETFIADKIITDLLDFTRIKSVEREPIAVAELVRQTLQRFPAPPPVEVALELPPDLPPVYANPRQMVQVLGNLAVNACQAMPTGGKLTITGYRQEQMVAIAVKDNGVGIPPENMRKLFEPLFTTKLKGIGLGLAVSKKLAEANGGHIEVESEPGHGTTFSIYLPVYREEK